MTRMLFVLAASALVLPMGGVQGVEVVCVSVSAGAQTAERPHSFANTGQTIIGVTTDREVEVLAGIMHCMLASGLSPEGDCNTSLEIDLPDWQALASNVCMNGPGAPYGNLGCACADYNDDGRIDLLDAAAFQLAIGN